MTETSTAYPEIEARIIESHANRVVQELYSRYEKELQEWFPATYEDPFGQVPAAVIGALQVIAAELRPAAIKQAQNKLHRKLIEGMEALLND